MTSPIYKASDLARELQCSTRKVCKEAAALGIGINLRGRAGYRFTEGDRAALLDAMRIDAPTPKRRRRVTV